MHDYISQHTVPHVTVDGSWLEKLIFIHSHIYSSLPAVFVLQSDVVLIGGFDFSTEGVTLSQKLHQHFVPHGGLVCKH